MRIAAITPISLLDYPGYIACILFTGGCNLRCGYCHNPHLVNEHSVRRLSKLYINEEVVFNFLKLRVGLLEGVVICGGEPTLHRDLPVFLKKIRSMGFKIKLDTNGTNPEMIQDVLANGLVDYIAMDVKTSEANYSKLVSRSLNFERLTRSIHLIINSQVKYEFRTTVVPRLHSLVELQKIGRMIYGADRWALQAFRNEVALDEKYLRYPAYPVEDLELMKEKLQEYVCELLIRG